MNVKKIICPSDFSDGSDAALATASSLARDNGAKLIIVHVHEPEIVYTDGLGAAYGALPQEQRANEQKLLENVNPTIMDIDFERRLITGAPASAILQFAEEEQADLIVMGTHGRAGVSRLVMGSVAEQIVRKASCPVLTIKEPS